MHRKTANQHPHDKAARSSKPQSSQSAPSNKSPPRLLTTPTRSILTTSKLLKAHTNASKSPAPLSIRLQPLHLASHLTTSLLAFSTQHHSTQQSQDNEPLNAPSGPSRLQTVPLSKLKPEYLRERPEIRMRAQFNRLPTREEVTGLVPDPDRDNQKYQFPGQKKKLRDNMLPIRDDVEKKFVDKQQTQDMLKNALNFSTSKLSESLLSLAIAEPPAFNPNDQLLVTAEQNIIAQLATAPSWDVDEKEKKQQQLSAIMEVKASEHIYQGNVKPATRYLEKRLQEAEEQNLPYFRPTGNVQVDEMNRRNLQKGILPMPNFAEFDNDVTPDDLTQIDQMAQTLARHVELSSHAKQSFDTAAKIVKTRLRDLPVDPDQFFPNAGCPTVESRNIVAYARYLKLVAEKGTVTQALDIYDEMRRKGMAMSGQIYLGLFACLKNTNVTPLENQRMLKEMMVNKPDLDKCASYMGLTDWVYEKVGISIFPKSNKTPIGAPEGFISCAPQIATYGAPRIRGEFTPAVEYAFYLLEQSKQNDTIPTKHMVSAVMSVCGEHRQYERAFALFEEFKRYAHGSVIDPKLAVNKNEIMLAKPHRDAKLEGFEPDQTMATVLMKACLKSGKHRLVEETFHQFWQDGMQPDAPMYNLVIASCVKGGHVEKAFKYFEQLQHFGHTPSIITYSSLIRACSAPSRPEFYPRAFEVFHECVSAGFRPDAALFSDLLRASLRQGHVHNLIHIFRVMHRDFPHLLDIQMYTTVADGLARSMYNDSLPGYGGYVLTRTGRTLFGSTLSGDKDANSAITTSPKIKLTREDRLAMIDALYAEVMLRVETQDSIGSQSGTPLRLDQPFLNVIVRGYTAAARGILLWDRHEKKEGREDPLLRLTPAHVEQLVERTWNKIITIQQQHPHIFKLDEHVYPAMLDVYAAADRMEDAVYHLLYMIRGLKIVPPTHVWRRLLDHCKKNAHHGPAMVIMKEMEANNVPLTFENRRFFQEKAKEAETSIVPNTFPSVKPMEGDREGMWQQPHRDSKTGKMVNHPMDWDVSWKDF